MKTRILMIAAFILAGTGSALLAYGHFVSGGPILAFAIGLFFYNLNHQNG